MNKARTPAVEIEFGGETRRLIYDFNALAELQDMAGTYKSDVASLKAIRAVVWAGLLAETLDKRGRETERTLSIIEVGEVLSGMSPEEIDTLVKSVLEARGIAEPPKDPTTAAIPSA